MPDAEGYSLIAELSDEDGSQQKEVYARFGLAFYLGQVFEYGLVNLIVIGEKIAGEIKDDDSIDRRFENLFSQTTGKLLRYLVDNSKLDDEKIAICRRAVSVRNRLAHSYFREHDWDFMNPVGRQSMLDEADESRRLFKRADEACTHIVMGLLNSVGISEDMAHAWTEKMLDGAERGGPRPENWPI